jgi:hypothetical protein
MIHLRKRLLEACKTKVGMGDSGDYSLIFDVFGQLIQAFKIRELPACQQSSGGRLRSQLKSVLESAKSHATRYGGVAGIIKASETYFRLGRSQGQGVKSRGAFDVPGALL